MARGKNVEAWITEHGGLAHGIDVREANFSRRDVDEALSRDWVRRVRRCWLMTRSADPAEVTAVRAGGRLTCVSAAKKAQLWVPDFSGIHICVPPTASRFDRTGLTVHWAQGPVPTPARRAQEPLLNVLFHVATCLPRMEALAVWESALHAGQVHSDMLQRVTWSSPSARELADAASVLSDSGLETYAVVRLSAFGVPLRQQVWIDGHPVDILIGERLVVQIDGEHHLERKQRRRDIRGDARLVLRGYTVLRFDYQQVLFDWPYVEQTVLAAIAQGLHRAA